MVEALKTEFGISSGEDIQTEDFSVSPSKDYNTGELLGYSVYSSYTLKIRDIDQVSSILDYIVATGKDQVRIESVDLQVISSLAHCGTRARELAAKDAMRKATDLIGPTGGTLGRLESLESHDRLPSESYDYGEEEEEDEEDHPQLAYKATARRSAGTGGIPISAGSNTVCSVVTAIFRIDREE